jgi:hypothetical protein
MAKDPARRMASADEFANALYPFARRKITPQVQPQPASLRDRASRLLRSA